MINAATTQQESARETAERTAKDFADFPSEWGHKLTAAIEAALLARDERAAKIAEKHSALCLHCGTALIIAEAVRCKG